MSKLFKIFTQSFFKYQKKREIKQMLIKKTLAERFTDIYEKRLWSSQESISGTGSTLDNTKQLRAKLPELVSLFSIKKIVDVPCGDFNWFKEIINDLDISYDGLDIVKNLISQNNIKYSTPKIRFEVADITHSKLPDSDLLIVRDCLFHFSFKDINKTLKNISNQNYKYLLTSSHQISDDFDNPDIVSGSYRDIDIFRVPFSFQRSRIQFEIIDDIAGGKKRLYLFCKGDVPESLSSSV